jgi:CRISPR-associated endonuclease/helicase Cas3
MKLSEGYAGQRNAWTPDTITPTRLGDEVTVFRLGRRDGTRIVPFYGDGPTIRNWALSEVSVNRKKAPGLLLGDIKTERAITTAKVAWPKWEETMPLLVLEPDGAGWTGAVTKDGTAAVAVRYDTNVGFRLK